MITTQAVTSVLVGGPRGLDLDVMAFSLDLRDEIKVVGRAADSGSLLAKVRASSPELVLVVLDGPEWGALVACAAIKDAGVHSRVVVLGAARDDAGLMAAVKAGADGYVTSDQGLDDVVAVLRRVACGESSIPGGMLGALLRGLIDFRREDDAVIERFASLGRREREVLVELVAGLDHQAIAAKLHLSPHTARTHTQNIFSKLGVHSRLEAAQLVFEHDLLARFGEETDETGSPR